MAAIRVLIVDDERIARNGLEKSLLTDPEVEIVGSAADGPTAISAIKNLKPDAVFLDIDIPEVDGFGVVSAVGVDEMPVLVFVTAYSDYTLKAFEVHALDYLLKPFDRLRLQQTLKRVKQQVASPIKTQNEKLLNLLEDHNARRKPPRRLPIKSSGRFIFLDLDEIDYIEGAGNYLCIHVGPNEFLTRETMAECEARLQSSDFVRIHRSVIVNRSRVKELKSWFTGEYVVLLNNGKELTLSRGYRDRLPLLLAQM